MKKPVILIMFFEGNSAGRNFVRGVCSYRDQVRSIQIDDFEIDSIPDLTCKKMLDIIESKRPDGIFAGAALRRYYDPSAWMSEEEFWDGLVTMGIPFVGLSGLDPVRYADRPRIADNDDAIGRMAARYFLDRGFRHFAYCGCATTRCCGRGDGFVDEVRRAGYEAVVFTETVDDICISISDEEKRRLEAWLRELPRPMAMFTLTDWRSAHVVSCCQEAGIRVPDDIAVLGVDNNELYCLKCVPSLSSIDMHDRQCGYRGAELLHQIILGKQPLAGHEIINNPARVIVRQSTDILAVEDEVVGRALKYIFANSDRFLQISDVVEAAGVSKAALYRRFDQALGQTVNSYIHKARLEHIFDLLIGTNLNSSQIANLYGYSDQTSFIRFFRENVGVTPQHYRNRYRS